MKNKRGFTLLEILIAATIVSALAILATVSYNNSIAETHIQMGKMNTEVLARAIQRFRLDYHADKLSKQAVELKEVVAVAECGADNPDEGANVYSLFNCGYLQNDATWLDLYIEYYVCNGYKTEGTPCANSKLDAAPLACMRGRSTSSKIPDKYKGDYAYCVNETTQGD